MVTPSKGSRTTRVIRTNSVARFPVDDRSPRFRQSDSRKMVSSLSFSTAVHAVLLFIFSWIYFDLPSRHVIDSILSLVISDESPLADPIEIDLPTPADPTVEPGDAAPEVALESIVPPDEVAPLESVTIDSQMTPGLDHARTEKATAHLPRSRL